MSNSKIQGVLTSRGLEINIEQLIEKYSVNGLKKIQNKFIIRYKSPIGTYYITKLLYFKHGEKIIFPRFLGFNLLKLKIIDNITNKITDGININLNYTGISNENQLIVINYIFKNIYTKSNEKIGKCGLTLQLQAGCHAKDTKILMYDGSLKNVQDITTNDLLMGDDSTPRKIINLIRGKGQMYQITNKKGESYIVNEDHILCLKYTNKNTIRYNAKLECYITFWFDSNKISVNQKRFKTKIEAELFMSTIKENYIVEVSVKDYLKLCKSFHKDLKEYKTKIEYPFQTIPIDPYMIGYWLGDGHSSISAITLQDSTILKYFTYNLKDYNCYLQYQNKYVYRINGLTGKVGSNYFSNTLRDLNLINNKHIPDIYKYNSRENRLKLLAGLLDSDGSLSKCKTTFEFTQCIKNEKLFDDVLYLARSLGFACYKKIKNTSWTYNNIKKYNTAYRMNINGFDIDKIPTLCPRKKANPRQQIKDPLVSQLSIKKLDIDNYYGFKVDKNNRYVMGSFTVTHNCGKSFVAMDIIGRLNLKTLIIVPNTYLLKQWVEILTKYFPNNTIGEYYGKNKRDGDIIVGIVNSLVNDEFILKDPFNKKIKYTYSYEEFYKQFGFIILDESHIYCTDIFKVIYHRFQSTYMLGLSATPNERNDKCDLISHANIGEVLDAHTLPNFIHSDIKFEADVHLIKYNGPDEYIKVHINPITNMICVPQMIEDITNDEYRNKLILNELLRLFELKLNIFVFSERRSHLEYLYNEFNCLLEELGNNIEDNKEYLSVPELNINNNLVLYGGSSDDDIETAKNKSNVIFTTYSYSSTGVSIDKMNAVILSTPRKSKAKQIIGRIFRLNKANSHIKRIIIDIIDNKTVLKHQLYGRMSAYKERDCTIIKKNINYDEII